MPDQPTNHDPRSDFWRRHFEAAVDYEAYLATSEPRHAGRWREMEAKLPPLSPEQAARLARNTRAMNVLVYTGVWCGDCVRQGPIIHRLCDAAGPEVEDRYIDREASAALKDELRLVGAERVPVVVFCTEDFFEVGRFGDRTLGAYRRKARREVGPACDLGLPPPPDEMAAELSEWLDTFERMLLMLRLPPTSAPVTETEVPTSGAW